MYKELVNNLREHADWAAANEWETPITLGDDLAQAAEAIERLLSELERNRGCEYCYTDAKSNPFVGGYNYCPMCGRKLKGEEHKEGIE